MLAYGDHGLEGFQIMPHPTSVVLEPPHVLHSLHIILLLGGVQIGVIREALVERVQPDVAAAVKEAIDVSPSKDDCTFLDLSLFSIL